MFPHEAQALMAKMMFIIFATIMFCMMKVRAHETPIHPYHNTPLAKTYSTY